jgi:hypothetical protein
MKKIDRQFLFAIFFGGALVAAGADLRTNQLMIGGVAVDSTVSNGTIIGDRWMVISNTLVRVHAEVIPLDGPSGVSSKDDSEQALRLMFQLGHGPTKDRSTMHGGVRGLHGLLYMAKGLNAPNLTQTSRVDVFSTEDKSIIVVMVRDNGPIYSSTNSGMTWVVINKPGTYEFPLTSDSDSDSYFAKATLYPSLENQTSTNPLPSHWYAIGSAPDGSKLVMTGDSSQPAPVLSIGHSGNEVIVSWPANFSNFILQQNNDLATPNWVDVTNSVNVVGEENQVVISPAVDNNFYRLKSKLP